MVSQQARVFQRNMNPTCYIPGTLLKCFNDIHSISFKVIFSPVCSNYLSEDNMAFNCTKTFGTPPISSFNLYKSHKPRMIIIVTISKVKLQRCKRNKDIFRTWLRVKPPPPVGALLLTTRCLGLSPEGRLHPWWTEVSFRDHLLHWPPLAVA